MYGTSDPMVPSGGGRSRGPLGLFARRRVRRVLRDPSLHESVAPDTLVADWLTANGIAGEPVREELGRTLSDPPVERLNWSADGALPVTMTRIVGGGHGWPGGPRYLPEWVIGKVPKYLDATGIVLDFFSARL
jgi:polyhydroxybutyrate depolymerase